MGDIGDFCCDDEGLLAVVLLEDDGRFSDEDDPEETVFVDIEGYRTMSNASFKSHFRMDRIVFQKLVVVVGNHMRATNRLIRLRTGLDVCLLMGLWPLFNPDTFRSSGLHFGKKKGSIHFHYQYVIEVLRELAPKYIKWPNALERQQIKTRFEEKYGYIGVAGCIDCVLIQISAPLEQPQGYVDRHHNHSMIVQAVCDDNLVYRDIYVGQPGGIGDVRNFERSDLSLLLLTVPEMLSEEEHLLGDGAYTLTSKIITPYGDDGHLTEWMRTHNALLSACRVKIENSFAHLRAKNRRLKYLPMRNVDLVNDHIVASFMLHNFIKLEGNECEGLPPAIPPRIPDDEYNRLNIEARNLGAIKREYIANVLHPHD